MMKYARAVFRVHNRFLNINKTSNLIHVETELDIVQIPLSELSVILTTSNMANQLTSIGTGD